MKINRSGLGGYANLPSKVECEYEKVMKKFCKNVPKKEEVMKEVEICVQTPKEVCININQGPQLPFDISRLVRKDCSWLPVQLVKRSNSSFLGNKKIR